MSLAHCHTAAVSDMGMVDVRPARDSDADDIRTVSAPFVTHTFVSFEEDVPTAEEMLRRMKSRPRLPWLVAADDREVVGFAYASRHRQRAAYRWSTECSVYLTQAYQGQGIARLLYERLNADLRSLGYVRALAGITLPNPASVRMHEALGYRPIGVFESVGFKLGQWRDVGWWSLPLAEPSTSPRVPLEWAPGV